MHIATSAFRAVLQAGNASIVFILVLSGCAHQAAVGNNSVPSRLPEDATARPAFKKPAVSWENRLELPASDEFSAMAVTVEDQVAGSSDAERQTHCAFGRPISRPGIDFGPTETVWREGYDLLHSADLKTPYWVCETYTRSSLEKNYDRGSLKFVADPELQLARAVPTDYVGSSQFTIGSLLAPIDIGHMAPAESHTRTEQRVIDTFYLSNGVPQNASMNRGLWARVEECARLTTPSRGKSWVISGPMHYTDRDVRDVPVSTIGDGVVVPTHTWKIVLSERSNEQFQAWAVVVPNEKPSPGWEYDDFAASIDDIEDATGFDFFPELPTALASTIEGEVHTVLCR